MDKRLIERFTAVCLLILFFSTISFAANRRQLQAVNTPSKKPLLHTSDNPIQRYWIETDSIHWLKTPIQPNDDSPRARRLHREGIAVYEYTLKPDYIELLKQIGADSVYSFHSIPAAIVSGSASSMQKAVQLDSSLHLHTLHSVSSCRTPSSHIESPSHIEGGGVEYGDSYDQLATLGIPDAQEWEGLYGDGVTIGVLDDGFELQHRCFRRLQLAAFRNFVLVTSKLSRWLRTEEQGSHGTGVLSLLAGYDPGRLIGGAPESNYLLARVFDERNSHNDDEASWAAGLEWCEEQGADIIQSSLTFEEPKALYDDNSLFAKVAQEIRRRGVILVCAAGNTGPKTGTITAPSAGRSVLAVGALNWDGSVAKYTSRGPTYDNQRKPDFSATGTDVLIASLKPPTFYSREDGTSYAAPLVSSAFALLREAHPDWTADRLEAAMIASSQYAESPDNERGYGTPWLPAAIVYPQLSGTVVDKNGKPLPNVAVQLIPSERTERGNILSTMTNKKGEFEVNTVEKGSYWLWVPPIRHAIPMQRLDFPPTHELKIVVQ